MRDHTSTQRRKAPMGTRSGDQLVLVEQTTEEESASLLSSDEQPKVTVVPKGSSPVTVASGASNVATVRRNFCGTGPFDQHWLVQDCCGMFCALFTYGLHLYGVYAVCFLLIPPWMSVTLQTDEETAVRHLTMAGHVVCTTFTVLASLAVISHFKAMTTDPGAVPPDAKPNEFLNEPSSNKTGDGESLDPSKNNATTPNNPAAPRRLCRRCRAYKPERAHHCSICKRCIVKMDHHCPWVNNCVGIGNHKYFLLFVFYTFLTCIMSLVLIIWRFSTCMHGLHRRRRHHHLGETLAEAQAHEAALRQQEAAYLEQQAQQHHKNLTCLDKPTQLLNILGLLIESLLFGMFTSCMMFDQMDVIFSKVTHIDRLKGTGSAPSALATKWAGVTEVFGVGGSSKSSSSALGQTRREERFRYDWLSPWHRVCFPDSIQHEIMGFCQPCLQAVGAGGETELSSRGLSRNGGRSISDIV